jgi:tetratricopeptide (TPR) repeat protein
MRILVRSVLFLLAVLAGATFGGVAPVSAQIPDKFENLKVLPKDISKQELVATMRGFSMALGVRCQKCHVEKTPDSLEGMDFKSDEKKDKKVARVMMQMVQTINDKSIPEADLKDPARVRCVTCHRGVEHPETLDMVLMHVIEKEGVPAALERYKKLREDYYGSGSYDFTAETLAQVAQRVADERKDVDGAIIVAKYNLGLYPEDLQSLVMLGRLYAIKGDKATAISTLEQALKLQPDNRFVQQTLERIRGQE